MAGVRNDCNTADSQGRAGGEERLSQVQATPKRVEDILDTDEARALLESGRENGSLTSDEIAVAFDDFDLEAGQLDELFQALEEQQVEIVPQVGADDEEAPTVRTRSLEASTDSLQARP